MAGKNKYNIPGQEAFDAGFSMEKFVSGDPATLSGLYENYFEPLCSDAAGFKRLDGRAPEDIVQDGFMKLWEHRTNFPHINHIKKYLRRVTRNNCIDRYRRESAHDEGRSGLVQHYAQEAKAIVTPLRWTEARDKLKTVRKTMDAETFPTPYRRVLLLTGEGLKYEEVAEEMSVPVGSVKSNIFFGRKTLKAAKNVMEI